MSSKSRGKTWNQQTPVPMGKPKNVEIEELQAAVKEIQKYIQKNIDALAEAQSREKVAIEVRSAAFEIFAHAMGPLIVKNVGMLSGWGGESERIDVGSEKFEEIFDELALDMDATAVFSVFASAKVGEHFWSNVQARRKKDVSAPTEFKEGDKVDG